MINWVFIFRNESVFGLFSKVTNELSFNLPQELGECMLEQKISLVYGSGKIGLMGEIAKTVHEGGGKVTGVTPGFIKSKSYTARSIISLDWYNRLGTITWWCTW